MSETNTAAGICAALGIEIHPITARKSVLGERQTCAVLTIERLIREHGVDHAIFVLRAIAETRNNGRELTAPTIGAISDIILAHPEWADEGLAFFDALDEIDLAEVRAVAKTNRFAVPVRFGMAAIIHVMLSRVFSPSSPRLL